MGATLTASRLRHRRGGRDVLQVDELSVAAGQRLAVLGPNGAGKTTLLRLLAGIERPTEGTVSLDGRPTDTLRLSTRRAIGYVTQQPGLLTATVRRNVELPLAWRGVPRSSRSTRVMAALERLGVAHLADRPAGRLSGGERQRVNLARSLALEPSVLLLDEPAAALDAAARTAFLDDIDHALADVNTTVVHVSHRPEEAVRGADQVAVLDGGRVRQLGTPAEVFAGPADERVARIVGYQNLVPIEVRGDGMVHLGGQDLGVTTDQPPGPATLAVWATGIDLAPPGPEDRSARVRSVVPGPGRFEVVVDCGPRLVVHLRADAQPPRPGDRVAVRVHPGLSAIVREPQ